MEDWIPFFSRSYWWLLATLLFARGMDLLSTYVATPNLALEGNPIAKALGWKLGVGVNLTVCLLVAAWPLVAVILSTTSVLVAARNFSVAWTMRAMGEWNYQVWYADQLRRIPMRLYLACLCGQTLLTAMVGVALVQFSDALIPMGIGYGIVAYAVAVLFFTLLGVWRRLAMRV